MSILYIAESKKVIIFHQQSATLLHHLKCHHYRLYYSPTAPLLTRWCSIWFHSFIDDELVRINPRLVIPALFLPLSASIRKIFILLSIPSLYLNKGFLTYKELVTPEVHLAQYHLVQKDHLAQHFFEQNFITLKYT